MKQVDILSSLVAILITQFHCPVYADEVKEQFQKPCFFISFTTTTVPQTVTITEKRMTVFLTYFPMDTKKNEVEYLRVFEEVTDALGLGILVRDRFIHVDSVTESRIGEEQDILQIKVELSYITIHTKESTAEPMENVAVRYITNY